MGSGMARRLLGAGYSLSVYNRTADRAAPLQKDGARLASTPREAVAGAMFVISMLADDAASRAVWLGENGALAGVTQRANQLQLLKQVLQDDLSVRALEKMIGPKSAGSSKSSKKTEPYLKEFEQKLMDKLGVRVQIQPDSIVISYASKEELTRVLKRLEVI
jgi:predicted DNA-binding protein YlxM (UPF0122 family)